MSGHLSVLEASIGYKFEDRGLLERALTHRSWAYENVSDATGKRVREVENETLEFVGDSVVGLIVAEDLYRSHESLSEGDLTLMKHHIVSTETLAASAKAIDLGSFLKVGKGEEKTGGRRKQALLADTFEALVAAVFFDGGYAEAQRVVKKLLESQLQTATPKSSLDYKTLLQETLQANKQPAPIYELTKTEGPSHERLFTVEAKWDGGSSVGTGTSIKSAEMEAANRALEKLGAEPK